MNKDFLQLVANDKMTWTELQDMLIKFNTAMARCQGEIELVKENAEAGGGFKWTFADWPTIRDATRKTLDKHGLSVKMYHIKKDGELLLVVEIKHSSGYVEITESPIICDTGNTKNKIEYGICGAITYYKRYVYNGIFGIATEEPDSEKDDVSDHDGNKQDDNRQDTPSCTLCGNIMEYRTRKSDKKPFWGCKGYPNCKNIINI